MKKNKSIEPVMPSSDTLYEKVGNRYFPVSQYYTVDYWHNGTYLVDIRTGMRSITRMIHPQTVVPEVEAALKAVAKGMMEVMQNKRNTPTNPTLEEMTPKQKKALEVWKSAFGDKPVWFPSQTEVVEAGISELRKYIMELNK